MDVKTTVVKQEKSKVCEFYAREINLINYDNTLRNNKDNHDKNINTKKCENTNNTVICVD